MKMMFTTKNHLGLSKFLKQLRFISEYFKWTVPIDKSLRETCYIRGYQSQFRFCPITAVAYSLYGANYSVSKWPVAAKKLDIPYELAEMVVKAADGGVTLDSEMSDLHETLLKTIGA